jgi:hypothetical protein
MRFLFHTQGVMSCTNVAGKPFFHFDLKTHFMFGYEPKFVAVLTEFGVYTTEFHFVLNSVVTAQKDVRIHFLTIVLLIKGSGDSTRNLFIEKTLYKK